MGLNPFIFVTLGDFGGQGHALSVFRSQHCFWFRYNDVGPWILLNRLFGFSFLTGLSKLATKHLEFCGTNVFCRYVQVLSLAVRHDIAHQVRIGRKGAHHRKRMCQTIDMIHALKITVSRHQP